MEILNSTINDFYPYLSVNESNFAILRPVKGEKHMAGCSTVSALYFVLSGEVEFSCNDHLKRRFKGGDMFFVPRSSAVYWKVVGDSEIMVAPFDILRIEKSCSSCTLLKNLSLEKFHIKYDFRPLKLNSTLVEFAALMRHYIQNDMDNEFLCQLKQKELFVIMRNSYSDKELLHLFYPILGTDICFKSRMLEVCHENLSVKELAEKFNMSQRNFSRRFREEFGESAHQWMLKEKARRIKLRFAVPGVTISDVIDEFGFTSQSYFWEYCRKQFGCTPQELMRKLRT